MTTDVVEKPAAMELEKAGIPDGAHDDDSIPAGRDDS